jgi:hypothetical protein
MLTVQHTPERFIDALKLYTDTILLVFANPPPLHVTLDDVKKDAEIQRVLKPPKKDLIPNQPLFELTRQNIKS